MPPRARALVLAPLAAFLVYACAQANSSDQLGDDGATGGADGGTTDGGGGSSGTGGGDQGGAAGDGSGGEGGTSSGGTSSGGTSAGGKGGSGGKAGSGGSTGGSGGSTSTGGGTSSGGSTMTTMIDPAVALPPPTAPKCTDEGTLAGQCAGGTLCRIYAPHEGRCEGCSGTMGCGKVGDPCTKSVQCSVMPALQCYAGTCHELCSLSTKQCTMGGTCQNVGNDTAGICK